MSFHLQYYSLISSEHPVEDCANAEVKLQQQQKVYME